MDLKEELEGVIDALERAGVPFGLCGGIAVTIHGAPRFTKDIDVLVLERDVERALAAVRSAGFTLRAGPMTFGARAVTPGTSRRNGSGR